jgi:hypothetical protein
VSDTQTRLDEALEQSETWQHRWAQTEAQRVSLAAELERVTAALQETLPWFEDADHDGDVIAMAQKIRAALAAVSPEGEA